MCEQERFLSLQNHHSLQDAASNADLESLAQLMAEHTQMSIQNWTTC